LKSRQFCIGVCCIGICAQTAQFMRTNVQPNMLLNYSFLEFLFFYFILLIDYSNISTSGIHLTMYTSNNIMS
jgi:hypothetical protein